MYKRKTFFKLVACLLTTVMICTGIPKTAFAAEDDTVSFISTTTAGISSYYGNTKKITVESYLTNTEQTTVDIKSCDIIFLMDQSKWMNTVDNRGEEREAIIESMKDLLSTLAAPTDGGEHRVAIAGYGRINVNGKIDPYDENIYPGQVSSATNISLNTGYYTTNGFISKNGWTEVKDFTGTDLPQMPSDYLSEESYESAFMTLDEADDILNPDTMMAWYAGASRMDAGLSIAEQLGAIARAHDEDNTRNLIVCIMSSSLPIQNNATYGTSYIRADAVLKASEVLKEEGATIFAFGDYHSSGKTMAGSIQDTEENFNEIMQKLCSDPSYFYPLDEYSNITDALHQLIMQITITSAGEADQDYTVTADEFTAYTDVAIDGTVDEDGVKTVTWKDIIDYYGDNAEDIIKNTMTEVEFYNFIGYDQNGNPTFEDTPRISLEVPLSEMAEEDKLSYDTIMIPIPPQTRNKARSAEEAYEYYGYKIVITIASPITVTYEWADDSDGYVPSGQELPDAETIVLGTIHSAAAIKSLDAHYSFNGWYTDPECTDLYEDDTEATADFTLYGKWTKYVIVNYHWNIWDNGYDYPDATLRIESGSVPDVYTPDGVEGYKFVGWYLDEEYSQAYEPGSVTEDIDLYAKWEEVPDPILIDDKVIIDYGKSVSVNVLENDTIYDEDESYISRTSAVDVTRESLGLKKGRTTYGTYTYSTDTITYTPKKYVDDIERIQYSVGSYSENATAQLSIIPATTVYYEDDFGTSSDSKSGIVYTGNWLTVGTSTTTSTSQDADIVGSDDANNYGYDSSYADDSTLSAGMAHVVEGEGKDTTATFTFNGTGFDIISRTNPDTGMITVRVYEGTDTSGTKVATLPVITTYYSGDLYQIPVINWSAEEYGTYTVEIMVNASNIFCKNTTFYLDAIRIYNPINPDGTDAEEALNAYRTDAEAFVSIQEFRDLLIDASTLTGDDDTINGIVYVDSCEAAADTSGEDVYVQYDTELSKYNQIGPNNEVYLAQGNAIGFGFINNDDASIAGVQIGAKAPDGSVKLQVVNVTKGTAQTVEINSAKDMYYDVTELCKSEDVFMILNASDEENILSLTNIKVTYKSETTEDSPYGFVVSADIGEEIQTTLSDILNGTFDIDNNESEDEVVFNESTNSITLPAGFNANVLPEVTKEGYLFTGWYLDPEYSTAYDPNKTIEGSYTLYAKWIDENVLTVKAQTISGTTTDSEKATLRFISTVDTLDYAQAGFIISYTVNGKEYNNTVAVTNVYTSIKAGISTVLPGVFSTESEYFITYTLRNIPNANFDTEITVTPYVVNEIGTTIYGTQRTVTVNDIVDTK